MAEKLYHAVTGAYGYSGGRIAERLLKENKKVKTLTNSLDRPNSFEGKVPPYPFNFDNPSKLEESLGDVKVLYNTYWVRFDYKKKSL